MVGTLWADKVLPMDGTRWGQDRTGQEPHSTRHKKTDKWYADIKQPHKQGEPSEVFKLSLRPP